MYANSTELGFNISNFCMMLIRPQRKLADLISCVLFPVLVPQVAPVLEAFGSCSQIITISNPVQPIDVTLGERQSTTPGGA